jgi:hypothetical protein
MMRIWICLFTLMQIRILLPASQNDVDPQYWLSKGSANPTMYRYSYHSRRSGFSRDSCFPVISDF